MTQANGKPTIHLSLPSRADYLGTLYGFFQSLGIVCDLDEETSIAIATAVIEAASNAVEHGNRQDASKRVEIDVQIAPDALEIEVGDAGGGIDSSTLAHAPQRLDDVLALRGRGIAMMRALMDDVAFVTSSGGTVVRLTKRFPSARSG